MGADTYKNEKHNFISAADVSIELSYEDGHVVLSTNLYEIMKNFKVSLITSDVLGKAFEPDQRFENPDGSDIVFDTDYLGNHRGFTIIPGPFAKSCNRQIVY